MAPMNTQSTAFKTRTNVLILKAVDRGFIGGVMVSMLASKVIDRWFIGGVMATDEPTIYCFREKKVNPIPMNSRSTAFETRMLIITPPMNPRSTDFETSTLTIMPTIYRFREKHANHYAIDEPTTYA
jgi:hypothetical protein